MTAWTGTQEALAAVGRNRAHTEGMSRVLSGAMGSNGVTTVWVPYRINDQLPRCAACGRKVRLPAGAATADCACGGSVAATSYI
ncbi:hypothetical protein [Pseudonocardia sp.]|uniref:hypothetical protein n=1 Tax=Pseudonocardia sp. TaxID=60912 RepID=UPI00260712A7|nr:hypothetical protein [Pseudonocardia sp.]